MQECHRIWSAGNTDQNGISLGKHVIMADSGFHRRQEAIIFCRRCHGDRQKSKISEELESREKRLG
jgi:hypothetical protein